MTSSSKTTFGQKPLALTTETKSTCKEEKFDFEKEFTLEEIYDMSKDTAFALFSPKSYREFMIALTQDQVLNPERWTSFFEANNKEHHPTNAHPDPTSPSKTTKRF